MQKKHLIKFNIHSLFKQTKKNSYQVGIEGTYLNTIKNICDKPTANITLNSEKLKAFLPKSGTRQECPFAQPPFNIVLKV